MKAVLLLAIFQSFRVIYGQPGDCAKLSNNCSSCLQPQGCAWCSDVDYNGAQCNTLKEHEKLQCSKIDDDSTLRNLGPNSCKITNANGTRDCEGNGECDCGMCKCNVIPGREEKYYGKFCQCSNFNCEQYENSLCGGFEKGECRCGKCYCKRGFKGSNCGEDDCSLYMSNCLTRVEGKPLVNCSNHGTCKCGKCHCDTFYEGSHCQMCPSCPGRCGDYQQCVLCKVFGDTPANGTLCDNCPYIEKVSNLTVLKSWNFPTTCQETDDEGCTYYYTYKKSVHRYVETRVYAVERKDCSKTPNGSSEGLHVFNVLVIVLGVFGGMVGIGSAGVSEV